MHIKKRGKALHPQGKTCDICLAKRDGGEERMKVRKLMSGKGQKLLKTEKVPQGSSRLDDNLKGGQIS